MTRITEQLADLKERIRSAAHRAGRDPASIRILAVSKKQPVEAVESALQCGLTEFGENYVQEALAKIGAVRGAPVWHFIGRIQSNKAGPVAEYFDWAHTVSSVRIAERLSARRPRQKPPMQVCIQIEPEGALDRGGIPIDEASGLAALIRELPGLKLRGLMMMPLASGSPEAVRGEYARTREFLNRLREEGHEVDTLSMGMSDDLEVAISEGSTLLRIGTALFGPRQ